ncbi:MAG: beta-xylosidase [Candidatus Sulfotelmatobacter sp.]
METTDNSALAQSASARNRLSAQGTKRRLLFFLLLITPLCSSQETPPTTNIQVHFDQPDGAFPPIWNYFGYDEPNYTYAPNGIKLLGELAALGSTPVYVRVHNLLTSGDGSASLKWGSTNVYSEDASGHPIYSWVILDRIFDSFHAAGVRPLVEIGFMPEALSTNPEPYRHNFPNVSVSEIYTGWAYPPKDYQKWSELVFQFVHHLRERYGDAEVKTWLWEVWNEPDIAYWRGTRDEYFKLYDFTVEAALRALPQAQIGGPETTGPANPHAAEFLKAFLSHCARGKNYATGKVGSRLDFISFHPKGSPSWQGDHARMGIGNQLRAIDEGFKIVASFPEWRHAPIILGESDPEGCAACSAKNNPQNLYRNGPLYGAYTVEVLNNILALASRDHINFRGAVTWAFEFEDQPFFAGLRELATNGLDKPVLNAFRMLGLLGNVRLKVSSSGALPSVKVVEAGIREQPDINAIAARKQNEKEIEILVWNYHDEDILVPSALIDLVVTGLPTDARRCLLEHFRIDSGHSNAFSAWQEMGSPQSPSRSEYRRLEDAGQLQMLSSPEWIDINRGSVHLQFTLPRQGLSLLRLAW